MFKSQKRSSAAFVKDFQHPSQDQQQQTAEKQDGWSNLLAYIAPGKR